MNNTKSFKKMTKTTSLLGILITIIGGIFLYMKLCSSCGVPIVEETVEETVVAPEAPTKTSYPFALSSGDYDFNVTDNFNFNVSSSAILTPVAQSVSDCIGSLSTFLGANENKVINVTGYYKSDEANNTAFPNLGMARANSIKNHLGAMGISSSRINTSGKLVDDMVAENNIFQGPIEYSLGDRAADADAKLQALFDRINADPLVFHFNTAEASINLSAAQRQKVADISRYLDQVSGATTEVVGHTDNEGSTTTNLNLGQGRADFAKNYLISNGIDAAKISTASKGESEPIASNTTEAGKAENRRTVVTLKQ